MKALYLALVILPLAVGIESAVARPFKIIASSNRRTTTHQLTSGNVTLGITDYGGGAINQFLMPGLADISDNEADRYGRMGQVAVRDSVHGGRYNPTQAGFHETLGTQCEVTSTPGKLVVQPHGIALWHGDGQYDFTRWENIGADPYTNDGGNSDKDGLDEENLSVVINGVTYTNQEAEVFSEYDYYGTYEDYKGKFGIQIPAFRHYHETRFIRVPGHCVNQHREGTPLYDPASLSSDMSATQPPGSFPGTAKELNNPISAWNFRWDNAKWTAGYRYFPDGSGWTVAARTGVLREDNLPKQAVIVAESNVATNGRAIGFYRPTGEINDFPVIGIVEATGAISYKDARTNLRRTVDEPFTDAGSMSVPGFTTRIRGLIARDRLPAGVYESWREELFIFYGTPQEIMDAIAAYDSPKQTQTITFPALPNKTTSDADFSPGATASSGLPVSYTSSDANVATIVGVNIHLVGAGNTTITASQAGNATYFAATNVSRQLVVTLSSLPTATVLADASDAGAQMTVSDGSMRVVNTTSTVILVGTSGGVSAPKENCVVFPFQLPDLGPATAPFVSASFVVNYASKNTTVLGNVDVYGLGRRAASVVLTNDYWNGTNTVDTTDATLLAQDLVTANSTAYGEKTVTGVALLNYLNAQYANGAGVSNYVFLRLSTDAPQSGASSRYDFTASEGGTAGPPDTRPRLTFSYQSAAKSNQTINFPALPAKKVGDSDFASGATASSGLPVSYASSDTNVATISGGNIHIVGDGTTTITASQGGNVTYNPALNVSQTLDVDPANFAPVLTLPESRAYHVGELVQLQASASDIDVPAQSLVFEKVSGPAGLTVSGSGQIAWTPFAAQAGQTYGVQIRVRDNGVPPQEDLGTFELTIAGPLQASNVAISGGGLQFSWNTIPGRAYGIQTSTNLIHWTAVADDLIATDVLMSTNLPISFNTMKQFYRVAVEAQP